MKKWRVTAITLDEVIVEAETAEEARMKVIDSGKYRSDTYISDAHPVTENGIANIRTTVR